MGKSHCVNTRDCVSRNASVNPIRKTDAKTKVASQRDFSHSHMGVPVALGSSFSVLHFFFFLAFYTG